MSAERVWVFRIDHILSAIEKIQRYSSGMTEATFAANDLVVDAVIRNFLVIGEAARNVPSDVQSAHPELPWAQMHGMRNILVHNYDAVRLDIVWNTIQTSLPPLVAPLQKLKQDGTA